MQQSVNQPQVAHTIESAGVDWITATAQKGSTRWDMEEYARHERERLMDAGASIKSGYRLGYYGWATEGFFHGQREGGSIVIASGDVAQTCYRSILNVSDNTPRIDLQVTVSTPIERPNLAAHAYHVLKSGSPAKVKVRNVTYIETHPQGATVNVGKRSSDSYGRIYDKATESGVGDARSRWRYEIELKRAASTRIAALLLRAEAGAPLATRLVHEWYTARGVAPIYPPGQPLCSHKPIPAVANRDVLAWFEESLSITVGKAVRRYGLGRVLESLSLLNNVRASREEIEAYAAGSRHTD